MDGLSLRTIFPYGLNDKSKKKNTNDSNIIGNLFHKLPRYGDRSSRVRRTGAGSVEMNKEEFFHRFHLKINEDIFNCANWLRITLNSLRKPILKSIAASILNSDENINFDEKLESWYLMIVDMIDTWLYRPPKVKKTKTPEFILKVLFKNKCLIHIRPSKILRENDLLETLPECLRSEKNIPLISYKLTEPIRNTIFNYQETVQNID